MEELPKSSSTMPKGRMLRIGIYLLLVTVFRNDEDDVMLDMTPVHMCDRTRVLIIAQDSIGEKMNQDQYQSCPSKSKPGEAYEEMMAGSHDNVAQ